MNEKLYSWTFKFHKVVRQQNSGAVEDFILRYSAVYLRIQKRKKYWNRFTFAKVIVKIKVAPFFMAHCVDFIDLGSAIDECQAGVFQHWHADRHHQRLTERTSFLCQESVCSIFLLNCLSCVQLVILSFLRSAIDRSVSSVCPSVHLSASL